MRKIIIAIDGYSACGKSSTAKIAAKKLGYGYVDTGAMYRATTLYFLEHYINLTNPKAVQNALEEIHIQFVHNIKTDRNETFLNGLNVEDEIRSMRITNRVSEVSAIADVRICMSTLQKKMGKRKGVIMDGRDIGTVVFPEAELKIFMHADLEIRAVRRQQELLAMNRVVDLDEVKENLIKRDYIDTSRKEGPLKRAEDAYDLNSSFMTLDEQVDFVVNLATAKIIEDYIQSSFLQ